MRNDKSVILAQKGAEQERKLGLRWLVALSAIPLFGIVAAFGIAPQTDTAPLNVQTVVENLSLPATAQPEGANAEYWRTARIQRGDTVASLLARLHVNDREALNFVNSNKDAKTLYQLMPGKTISAETGANGELLSLRYLHPDGTLLKVEKAGDGFTAAEQQAPLEAQTTIKSGEIRSSLFAATDAVDLPDAVASQLVDIFSTDIDFHHDLRKGDRFTVIYQSLYNGGTLLKAGRVLAAEFVNQGKVYRAVYFEDGQGRGGYYTPEGKNLHKAFLRSPLPFTRITSGFSMARYHPILHKWRAHTGTDFTAPIGTPVRATADGAVAFIGKENGYGNFIVLKHQGNLSTAYGHLSRFAKGLHRGSKVTQGEVIAYVGMTGLATGPHLHYEFRVAGIARNPMTVALPTAFPIAPRYRQAFTETARPLVAQLGMLQGINMASLD